MRRVALTLLSIVIVPFQIANIPQPKQGPKKEESQEKKWHTFTDKCPKECKDCQNKIKECMDVLNKSLKGNSMVCGLAFLAEGSTHNKGNYSKKIQDITTGAMKRVDEGKFMLNWDLGFIAIFLAEVQLKTPTDYLKQRLEKLVDIIAKKQEKSGGWAHTYIPECKDKIWKYTPDLLACTNFIAVGLAQIEKCGVKVPQELKDNLAGYYKKCANRDGTFYYASSNRQSEVARMAFALVAFELLNLTDTDMYKNAATCFDKNLKKVLGGHASLNLHRLTAGVAAYRKGKDLWKRFCDDILSISEYKTVNKNDHDKDFRTPVDAILLLIPYENLSFLKPKT